MSIQDQVRETADTFTFKLFYIFCTGTVILFFSGAICEECDPVEGNEASVLPWTHLFPGFYQVIKHFLLCCGSEQLAPPGGHAAAVHNHTRALEKWS